MSTLRAPAALAVALLVAAPARADIAEGMTLFERGRFGEAAEVLGPLAGAGDPRAQYVLGVMYHAGMVEAPGEGRSLALLEASAEAGYLPAQTELARIYRNGDGVPQDSARMMHWYLRAARNGDVGAQLFVADGYAFGNGVPRDPVEAYMWYEIALRYWGHLAERARDLVAEDMTGAEIAEARRRAGAWLAETPGGE